MTLRDEVSDLWMQAETLAILTDVLRFQTSPAEVLEKLPELRKQLTAVGEAVDVLEAAANDG